MQMANGTRYDTRELRKVFNAVLRDTLKQRPTWAARWKRWGAGKEFRVHVRNSSGALTGRACVNAIGRVTRGGEPNWNIFLSIPDDVHVTELAAVMRHELYHSFGARHGDMGPEVLHCDTTPFEHYPMTLGLPERLKRRAKAKRNAPDKETLQRARVAKLVIRRKALVTRARRLMTLIEKIDASLKRYEKQGHDEAAHRPPVR